MFTLLTQGHSKFTTYIDKRTSESESIEESNFVFIQYKS